MNGQFSQDQKDWRPGTSDSLMNMIDDAIAQTKKAIDAVNDLRQTIMSNGQAASKNCRLFGTIHRSDWRHKSDQTNIARCRRQIQSET